MNPQSVLTTEIHVGFTGDESLLFREWMKRLETATLSGDPCAPPHKLRY